MAKKATVGCEGMPEHPNAPRKASTSRQVGNSYVTHGGKGKRKSSRRKRAK